jgi:GNAT superfamily N-acetyltransferase
MSAETPCQYLDWDSEFFGLRIARILSPKLNGEQMEQVLRWRESQCIDCVYWLVHADDSITVRLAEDCSFRLVDTPITFERTFDDLVSTDGDVDPSEIRISKPSDIPGLQAIAGVSHHDSRFYHDPNFPVSSCDSLYAEWIKRSCEGYADVVLVAVSQDRPIGYISCHLVGNEEGKIGLFAVDRTVQGVGFGRRLLGKSLGWFKENGAKYMTVVTQARNCKAQRFYQRNGFVTRSVGLWYHRWFRRNE